MKLGLLSEEQSLILYELWGNKDFFEEDKEEAIKLGCETFPDIDHVIIEEEFIQFLADNDER